SRLRLDDFDLRVARADLLFEPLAGLRLAMAEQYGARGDLIHEVEKFVPIGMGGEIEVLHFAVSSDFAGAGAEQEGFARFGRFEPAAGGVRVGVTDEEDGLPFRSEERRV